MRRKKLSSATYFLVPRMNCAAIARQFMNSGATIKSLPVIFLPLSYIAIARESSGYAEARQSSCTASLNCRTPPSFAPVYLELEAVKRVPLLTSNSCQVILPYQ